MAEWFDSIRPDLEKLDNLLSDKPYLKDIIVDIIKENLPTGNRVNLESILDDAIKFDSSDLVRCLIVGYSFPDFASELEANGFSQEFTTYVLKISLTYGKKLYHMYYYGLRNTKDWNTADTKLIVDEDGEKNIHVYIKREDSMDFSIIGDRYSIFNLVRRILSSPIISIYGPLSQNEQDILAKINEHLESLKQLEVEEKREEDS